MKKVVRTALTVAALVTLHALMPLVAHLLTFLS